MKKHLGKSLSTYAELEPILIQTSRKLNTPFYVVGGTLRDQQLKRPCHDIDLALRGSKKAARALSKALDARLVVLDAEREIYRLVLHPTDAAVRRTTLDLAELRGPTIQADLAARDFTINAMAQEVGTSKILDPHQGSADLKARRLKQVSAGAFEDDPLRLLRAFRLAAQFNLKIEPKTLSNLKRRQKLLWEKKVAAERIREELLRFFDLKDVSAHLEVMDQVGLLTQLVPEMEAGRTVARDYYGKGGVMRHALDTVSNFEWLINKLDSASPLFPMAVAKKLRSYLQETVGGFSRMGWLKFAALIHDIGKPATAQRIGGRLRFFGHEDVGADLVRPRLQALRLSREEQKQVGGWVRNHMRLGNLASAPALTEKALARFWRDLNDDGIGMVLLSLADHYDYLSSKKWLRATDPVEKMAGKLLERYFFQRAQVLPPKLIDGHDLIKQLKLKPGRIIGQLLEAIVEAQVEKKIQSKAEALAYAQKLLPKLVAAEAKQKPH